ncbi:hypothetical protein GALMADRAFT_154564 [Galerina marginata CBS 339.88]|uniref:Rhodopsin domain-containing protein n=1 Tax=Galerina marginata (strain CBS 339.88) TaxID=685588 RepID=A0A067T5X5_GALM3|nr:hypothetical protein GALMADRAFT_154564 [Galerina marginata CBS 339.88]
MPLPIQSVPAWKGVISIFHIAALSSTVVRIFDRFYMGRMWWDDYLAFLPLISNSTFFIAVWKGFEVRFRTLPTSTFYGFFFITFLHFTTIWSSRTILALALARLFPSWSRTRTISFTLASLFCLAYILVMTTTMVTCSSPGIPFYHMTGKACLRVGVNGTSISSVMAISCDFVADASLVVFSVHVLWHIKLPKHQRRLIRTTASASILTLLSVTLFCVLWYGAFDYGPDTRLLNMMATHLEDTTSLIVANLLVVVTLIYRIIHKFKMARQQPPSNRNQPASEEVVSSPTNGATTSEKPDSDMQHDTLTSRDQLTAITWTDIESNFTPTSSRNQTALVESGFEYLDVDSRWAGTERRSGYFR